MIDQGVNLFTAPLPIVEGPLSAVYIAIQLTPVTCYLHICMCMCTHLTPTHTSHLHQYTHLTPTPIHTSHTYTNTHISHLHQYTHLSPTPIHTPLTYTNTYTNAHISHIQLVDTTVEIANKVGGAEIVSRIVEDLKDENEQYRKMVMDCTEKVCKQKIRGMMSG